MAIPTLFCALLLTGCISVGGSSLATPRPQRQTDGLSFVLRKKYEVGDSTRVRLRNTGDTPYRYNSAYEACDMVFRDSEGRRFLVPEGTHCDMVAPAWVEPGETVTLFTWDLDECIKDEWGCTRARDLPPGRYTMTGRFPPRGGGEAVRVVGRFRITR